MIALWLLACAQDPCAGTEDMTTSPAGLELTAEEHDIGWGETECFLCHQAWTIHAQDCVDGVRIDVAAIEDRIDEDDTSSCVACHGSNGVEAWAELVSWDSGEAR